MHQPRITRCIITSCAAITGERCESTPYPTPSETAGWRWHGWRGGFLAHKEKDKGHYTEEHYAKDPRDIIIGQHRCLPIHQGISHHESLVLGCDGLACLLRQASRERCVIPKVGTTQGADVGA